MLSLVLYFLCAFGLAYIVGHSAISEPIRSIIGGPIENPRPFLGLLIALVECPACFGTWVGAAVGAYVPGLFLSGQWWAGMVIGALATCAVNFLLARWTGLLPEPITPEREAMLQAVKAQQDAFESINRASSARAAEPDPYATDVKSVQRLTELLRRAIVDGLTPGELNEVKSALRFAPHRSGPYAPTFDELHAQFAATFGQDFLREVPR